MKNKTMYYEKHDYISFYSSYLHCVNRKIYIKNYINEVHLYLQYCESQQLYLNSYFCIDANFLE